MNVDFENADLSDCNLQFAFLLGANLKNVNLADSDLSGAILQGCNLEGANLSNCNLTWSTISNANLKGADLSSSDLRSALLSDAVLVNANMAKSKMGYLALDRQIRNGRKKTGYALASADSLKGTYLVGADLSYANLSGADFDIPNCYFKDPNGRSAVFINTVMPDGNYFHNYSGFKR